MMSKEPDGDQYYSLGCARRDLEEDVEGRENTISLQMHAMRHLPIVSTT